MKKVCRLLAMLAGLVGTLGSCDDAGCTLYNSTLCHIVFYSELGISTVLTDTLTVYAVGAEDPVYNMGKNLNTLKLQLSYYKDIDTLLYEHWMGTADEPAPHQVDTLFIRKTDTPHFESPDCGVAMFHDIEKVWWANDSRFPDTPLFTDVYVNHPQVYYNSEDNIHLFINKE